ncbi:MAG: hypothetical protein WKG07_11855 [Hymenobacter sp.]
MLTTQGVLATAPAALSKQVNVFPKPGPRRGVGGPARFLVPPKHRRNLGKRPGPNGAARRAARRSATSQLALPSVAHGVYTLRLLTAEGAVNKRLIVE